MEKGNPRKTSGYSEAFLKRFQEIYASTPTVELDKILRQEFPEDTKGRSINPGIWNSLAHRCGLKKGNTQKMEDTISIEINPSTPDVEIPRAITFGKVAYPVELLKFMADKLHQGVGLTNAFNEATNKFNAVVDPKCIPPLGNFFRLRFKTTLSDFSSLSTESIGNTLLQEQRIELVRKLRNEKWRDLAIIEKTAELFPDLRPLTLDQIRGIRNFWRAVKGGAKKREYHRDPEVEKAPVARSLVKLDEYTLAISGPKLQYNETVTFARAKAILKTVLTEDK